MALRIIYGILRGLISIGKTRFLTWYYAIKAFLPCLAPILDLIKGQVILVKPGHPLYWMRDKQAVRAFEDSLRLEMALLEPFARSVKCLESSASTPADVCLFWLASQATLNDMFTDSDKRADLMISEETIGDVRAIMNGQCSEMFDGSNRRMYISTLFLDPGYIGSTLFTRKNINPLATMVYLPVSAPSSSSQPMLHDIPDQDLRDTLPVYRIAGGYLGELLVHEINSGREKLFQSYPSDTVIIEEFRLQFMNYFRQTAPFGRHMGVLSALEYWTSLSRHPHAQIIAYLAIKLFSVVPNSMAEEQTVSCFTKLNSPDRARQKTSTLLFMTQIKQHEQRIE
ncbi:hypothetical protein FRC06_009715, partial [Ceratobasidium sp. 370]